MKTVYWSNFAGDGHQARINLLMSSPELVAGDYFIGRSDALKAYSKCPAHRGILKNTFLFRSPFDIDVNFGFGDLANGEKSGWLIPRHRNFDNRITAEIDLGWLFFSEEKLEIEVFPPFLHKTKVSQYGQIAIGGFDISQWFRPVNPTHILWENESRLVIDEGDPLLYVRFLTEEKVDLKQFYFTPLLKQYSDACTSHIDSYKNNIPLISRYEKFKEAKFNQLILKEIQNNLI